MSTTERSAFRHWRQARPFWGGLLLALGGTEMFLTIKAPLPVVLHVGMGGLAGYLIPILIAVCGVLVLANPGQRLFYSLVGAILALASWLTSNLGGFVVGLLLALVGSALAFAWTPRKGPAARIASREDASPEDASRKDAADEQTPDGPSPEEKLIDQPR